MKGDASELERGIVLYCSNEMFKLLLAASSTEVILLDHIAVKKKFNFTNILNDSEPESVDPGSHRCLIREA